MHFEVSRRKLSMVLERSSIAHEVDGRHLGGTMGSVHSDRVWIRHLLCGAVALPLTLLPLMAAAQVVIDFDDIDTSPSGAVPLTDQFAGEGVVFSEVAPDSCAQRPAVVVEDGLFGNGATSLPNAGGYGYQGFTIQATFVDPATGRLAATDAVSAQVGDRSPEADPITMTAFDIDGNVLGSSSFTSVGVGDFGLVSISAPGIHRVELADADPSGASFDDFTFNPPVALGVPAGDLARVAFVDGDFVASDYTTVTTGTGTSTVTTETAGGNPDRYRRISLDVDPGENVVHSELYQLARVTPTVDGPVQRVRYCFDVARVATSNPGATQVAEGIAVEQDGTVYRYFGGVTSSTDWLKFEIADIVPLFPAVDWTSGSTITFGFYDSVSTGTTGFVLDGGYDNLTVEVVFAAAETTPTADAGPDQTVEEGDPVELDGSGSGDPNGDPLTFGWTQVAGPPVALSDPTAPQPTFTAPYLSTSVTLTFELVVSDGSESSVADSVDVTVVDVNQPPVADAGDDATIKEGATATLDGSNSFDPEGDTPLEYTWTQTAGPAVGLQPNGMVASPIFTAPLGVGNVLSFELVVGDGKETGASDSVEVAIVENSSPVADAGADQTVDEGSLVELDGAASSDPDGGDVLSFEWTQVAGTAVVLDDATSATPGFGAPSVAAGGEDLVFELVVTDDDPVNPKSSTADGVIVSVLDVNDPPFCELARSTCPGSKLDSGKGCRLWPPNHKMWSVGVTGVTDPDEDDVTIEITGVTQDEPVDGQGDGDSSPDAVIQVGTPADSVLLRAERTGLGGAQENGRVYSVGFTASDGSDGCSGSVTVGVPHDRKDTPVDDGQLFDSTQP